MSLDRLLAPLRQRVMNTIARCVVSLVNDATKMQSLQIGILKNENRQGVERFQNYGFTSVPKAGAEAVVVSVGGNRDHSIVIAVDDRRYRLKALAAGEVAIYSDEGDSIILKRGNKVEVNTSTMTINASTEVVMETPVLKVSGEIIDNYETNPNNMSGMRNIYNTHTHNENNNPGGPTNAPNQGM